MYDIKELNPSEFPLLLSEINDPPSKLYFRGALPCAENKMLCVVGSRHYTNYGREVCEQLIRGLTGFPITIVSGLALGIDGLAHQSALKAGLQTIAVPGSGLSDAVLYPARHHLLAQKILESGGGLISEFAPEHRARPENFPQRNRIMAGLSHAILIIEAKQRSGTLITARLAADYNREVLAVPGSLFSQTSEGPHMLIKLGAQVITKSEDILEALGFSIEKETVSFEQKYKECTQEELKLLQHLESPQNKSDLLERAQLKTSELNILLSTLELKGFIKEKSGLWYLI